MSEETKEQFSIKKINISYIVHMLLTLLSAAGFAWFTNMVILENAWSRPYFIFAGAICAVIVLCSFLERKKIYGNLRTIGNLFACFLLSGLLLFLSDYYVNLPVWMLGGIIAAALVSRNIGMLYLYYFVFHAIYLQGNQMNGLVFHLVIATFIAFFIPKMKTFLGMVYMMAFAACLVVTGSLVHNRMIMDETMLLDTFYILCSYLGCIFITMLLVKWTGVQKTAGKKEVMQAANYEYLDLMAQDAEKRDAEIDAAIAEAAASKDEKWSGDKAPKSVNYSPYCDEKSELLQELKVKNKSIYAQAILVGKLASETAQAIGLDAGLTKAAGLYKKIGKIREENDETTSVKIAKEHNFPEPLIKLLDQLNRNVIEQKEAALLLITDGVISYYSIVRHVQKTDISVEKIVDAIVSKKIFQGEFNESGLSMQECFLLREKLIDLLEAQDKKRTVAK